MRETAECAAYTVRRATVSESSDVQRRRGGVTPLDASVALSHQPFDVGPLASLAVGGVGVTTVNTLLPEPGALPDQVVDGALQLGDAILEIADGRARIHGSSRKTRNIACQWNLRYWS